MTPLLGFYNLLIYLTEVQKTPVYIYQFNTKARTQEQTDGRDVQGEVYGSYLLSTSMCFPTQKLSEFHYSRVFYNSISRPFPSLNARVGWMDRGAESSYLLITG